jgi:hypothetical protein
MGSKKNPSMVLWRISFKNAAEKTSSNPDVSVFEIGQHRILPLRRWAREHAPIEGGLAMPVEGLDAGAVGIGRGLLGLISLFVGTIARCGRRSLPTGCR